MKKRSAIINDLFAPQLREGQLDHLGDPLAGIEACIDFQALSSAVDERSPRDVSKKGGRPPYPTEILVRILVLKRLNLCRMSEWNSFCWIGSAILAKVSKARDKLGTLH